MASHSRVLASLLLPGLMGGCGTTHYAHTPAAITQPLGSAPERHLIDERAGKYRGVGLDDRPAAVERKIRIVARSPADIGFVRETSRDIHPAPQSRPRGNGWLANREVFIGLKSGRVAGVTVQADGAATSRAVAIGDVLDDAERAYPGLTCGKTRSYSEGAEYPACAGRVAPGVFIWFGGDPIDAIQMSPFAYPNVPRP